MTIIEVLRGSIIALAVGKDDQLAAELLARANLGTSERLVERGRLSDLRAMHGAIQLRLQEMGLAMAARQV